MKQKSVPSGPKENPKATNAQIITELNRVKCEFQLRTICAVMGVKP